MPNATCAPQFLHCSAWTHCFAGSKESVVRWLTNADCTSILYAEVKVDWRWVALDRSECLDVLESLKCNNLPAAAEDFGIPEASASIPQWVPPEVADLCREHALTPSPA